MSIAGKVLIVLVSLMVVVWALLMSGVAEYNRLGGKALVAEQAKLAKAEQAVLAKQAEERRTRDLIAADQVVAGRNVVILREKQFAVQQELSVALEDQSREQIALADQKAALKNATIDRDHRVAEKKQEETELARAESEVERLKTVNSQLMVQLGKLRDELKMTYLANKTKVAHSTKK